MTASQLERFFAKVDYTSGACWTWVAATGQNGYGYFGAHKGTRLSHRLSYEHFVGPIPDGLQIDHLCRNRACVNPTHVEPVTAKENVRRSTAGAVTAARNIASKGQPKPPRTPLHRARSLAALELAHQALRSITHCPRGHVYDAANTYLQNGSRSCVTCRRDYYWRKKREAA